MPEVTTEPLIMRKLMVNPYALVTKEEIKRMKKQGYKVWINKSQIIER